MMDAVWHMPECPRYSNQVRQLPAVYVELGLITNGTSKMNPD